MKYLILKDFCLVNELTRNGMEITIHDGVKRFGSYKFYKDEIRFTKDQKPLKVGGTAYRLIEEGYMMPLSQCREDRINEILND